MEIEKAYNAKSYEDLIYSKWETGGYFKPKNTGKTPFVISMPPPNATGQLHLGHATMLAIEDLMIRYHRMKGFNALWVPGTDHAGIATQSVVEKKLFDEGIRNPREELGRDKLLSEIKVFVEKSKSTIRNQTKKMGSSCDWDREKYTMDDDLAFAVEEFFELMYKDGLIYRGYRAVNWDPNMQTTVADDELEYIEEQAEFYHLQYGPFVIATSRPETKFGDKIVVVHPDDPRYTKYHNQKFEVDWINGKVECMVITDKAIDMEFGTGVMTITPWHDKIDFGIMQRHQNEVSATQIIGFDGKMLAVAGEFEGMTIKQCRKALVEKMQSMGLIVKIEPNYTHKLAVNYRGKGVIEPQIMRQWFIDVNKKAINWKGQTLSIKEVISDTVRSKMIEIIPPKFEKIYFSWIDNLQDWCISRQIWWGHRIPMWYNLSKEDYDKYNSNVNQSSYLLDVLKVTHEGVFSRGMPAEEGNWIQDPDTLDTWFSASLWTFATLGWPKKTDDLLKFHPTAVLETGYDILFFWVARMIIGSTYCLRKSGFSEEQSIPFKKVYLHGLIRDKNGKKMSKSSPETCIDPLDMIEKYGTDSIRLSLIIGSTPGNDMNLYEEKIAGYRNFVNKIWNSARFVLMNVKDINAKIDLENLTVADKWVLTEINELIEKATKQLDESAFSNAGNLMYEFLWNSFCDWYLEMSKVKRSDGVLMFGLTTILKLLHPITPFVTEAIWGNLKEFGYEAKTMLIEESWPTINEKFNFKDEHQNLTKIIDIIKVVRQIRTENKVDPVKKITAYINGEAFNTTISEYKEVIVMMANLANLEVGVEPPNEPLASATIGEIRIDLPLNEMVDKKLEIERLKKEIANLTGYAATIKAKLNNTDFTGKAPQSVIDSETKKLEETESKVQAITEALAKLA